MEFFAFRNQGNMGASKPIVLGYNRLKRQDYCDRHGRRDDERSQVWMSRWLGNIGPAVLNALMRREDSGTLPHAWVLEVSSFQLGNDAES